MGKKNGRGRGDPGEEEGGKEEIKGNPTVRGRGEDRRGNLKVKRRLEEERRREPLVTTLPPPSSRHFPRPPPRHNFTQPPPQRDTSADSMQ